MSADLLLDGRRPRDWIGDDNNNRNNDDSDGLASLLLLTHHPVTRKCENASTVDIGLDFNGHSVGLCQTQPSYQFTSVRDATQQLTQSTAATAQYFKDMYRRVTIHIGPSLDQAGIRERGVDAVKITGETYRG